MAKKKQAQVSVGFAINSKSLEQITSSGSRATVEGGQVIVKSGARTLAAAPGGGGYETRLWERVTCDFLGGGLAPGDIVMRPDLVGVTVTPAAALKRATRSRKSARKTARKK
jgi:hypothetical protein